MKTQILSASETSIRQAARIIRENGVIGMPTETVYGLAGAAFSPDALLRIFSVKERPAFDPLIIHIAAKAVSAPLDQLEELRIVPRASLSKEARTLVERLTASFWPGPLTLVLPKHANVPDLATSGLSTVAVRMPRHPVAQALIKEAGVPLAAPSANRFGRISPTTAQHVLKELDGRIELVLDGGPCDVGLESTIIAVNTAGDLTLLRPGGIAPSEIERITGAELNRMAKDSPTTQTPAAPGRLASHYAPGKPLKILPSSVDHLHPDFFHGMELPRTLGLLVFGPEEGAQKRFSEMTGRKVVARSFTGTGNLEEAAKNLFSGLRHLDESEAEIIFSEPCPFKEGLGLAIADRLSRASHPR